MLRLRSLACAAALSLTACSALFGVDFEAKERADGGGSGATVDTEGTEPGESTGPASGSDGAAPASDASTTRKDATADSGPVVPPPPPPRACPYPAPASYPWKDRRATDGACAPARLDTLTAELGTAKPVATIRAELAAASPACAACVFSRESDTKWAAVVTDATYGMDDSGGGRMTLNKGGCMLLYAAPLACAKAYQNANTCAEERCDGCVKTGSGDACMQNARLDPATCKPHFDQVVTACGSTFAQRLLDCADLRFLLSSFCG